MKWKTKREEPKSGDVRSRYVFAWKPTQINDITVWLETYGVNERFFTPASGEPGWWSEISRWTLDPSY